jgi:SAM-dependent MidA family methyltransferase
MNMPAKIICNEIAQRGVLPFARFMELALYCPEIGYYETKKDNVGKSGDFYTSVSVGNLFGELLAFQFSEWLAGLSAANNGEKKWTIVEAGAHDGKLAGDILNWLQMHRWELFQKIEYVIVEPSAHRKKWQQDVLKVFAPYVRWVDRVGDLGPGKVNGVIFSNELLDAMPVNRYGWDARQKKWFEWGVTVEKNAFAWTHIPISAPPPALSHVPRPLLNVLPDGYTVDLSAAAEDWWRAAVNVLGRGWLMTIDYGLSLEELLSPSRAQGTLRGYFKHQMTRDVLGNVGQQDLTAHVNFSAIQKIGEENGLISELFGTQLKFLAEVLLTASKSQSFGEWNPGRRRQFQTLTHPEHLGHAFRVLVQSRG